MRAIQIRQHGGFEALQQQELPTPEPGPGEVRVRVRACGINHLDTWVRRGVPGHTFPLPLVPGSDVAGTVDALGAGCSALTAGDAVVVAPGVACGVCRSCLSGSDHHCRHYGILGEHRDGGCAELIVVPRANVIEKPAVLSFEQAAGVGIGFLTAWQMLVGRAELRPGETVLVQAAASGVGSAAVQIAKLWGATVIAAASSEEKLALARDLGADDVVHSGRDSVAREVRRLTANRGVDVVVEHVGATTWQDSMRSLAWQGRLVTCGATTGAHVELDLRHLFFKSLSVLGSTMGSKGQFCEVLQHVAAGRLRPVLDNILPLCDIAEAHRRLEARQVLGKLVVVP